MNAGMRAALKVSHTPAARKKAVATAAASRAFAARFGAAATEFASATLLRKFMTKHGLGLADVPPALHRRLGKRALEELRGANGHDVIRAEVIEGKRGRGVGIPLDAIPERKKPNGGSGIYPRTKGRHPNAELIGKILDMLGKPDTSDAVAERLGKALDKLIG